MGERTPVAAAGCAGVRDVIAVGEAHDQCAGSRPMSNSLRDVRLSAATGWRPVASRVRTPRCMPRSRPSASLSSARRSASAIPVGKDSLSMRTAWQEPDGARRSVVGTRIADRLGIRAASPTCAAHFTPQLRLDCGDDLAGDGGSRSAVGNRLGGSMRWRRSSAPARCLAVPDLDDPATAEGSGFGHQRAARVARRRSRARLPRSQPTVACLRRCVRDGLRWTAAASAATSSMPGDLTASASVTATPSTVIRGGTGPGRWANAATS